jgi:hypothetical protein
MINELGSIVLTTNLPEYGLTAGDLGTVVMIHAGGEGFEVKFVNLDGETLAVTSLGGASQAGRAPGNRACSPACRFTGVKDDASTTTWERDG